MTNSLEGRPGIAPPSKNPPPKGITEGPYPAKSEEPRYTHGHAFELAAGAPGSRREQLRVV